MIESKLKPKVVKNILEKIKDRQALQKKYFDRRGTTLHKPLRQGDPVRYMDHNKEWPKGIFISTNVLSLRNYQIINTDKNNQTQQKAHNYVSS